jgi:hypothetical protein
MSGKVYTCPGCREVIIVAAPDGNSLVQTCPIPECRRIIWMRSSDGQGLQLFTDHVPDLGAARFMIDQHRLLDHGVELLIGPADRLELLCDLLNADTPPDHAIPAAIRSFIQDHGKGCTFSPGYRLVQLGRAALEHRERITLRDAADD